MPRLRLVLALALGLGLLLASTGPSLLAAEPDPAAALARLDAAWRARDEQAYLAVWRFPSAEAEARERLFLRSSWSAEEAALALQPPVAGREGETARAAAEVFTVTEPRARAAEMAFVLAKSAEGWAVTGREDFAQIDGLVHLSLAPEGYTAAGLTLKLEDFELAMASGTLFTSPHALGPTVMVFVGEGTVRFTPRPEPEREQLRQFSGRRELVERVRSAFIRIHPADLHRVVSPARFAPDPGAARRWGAARRLYRSQVDLSFLLDVALPRSPWWLLPGLGDAVVTFPSSRGMLTFAASQTEAEGITLFDRGRQRQVCLYPVAGRTTSYDEDAHRPIDVLHHDLSVRFGPERHAVWGEDTLRIAIKSPSTTIRLRLHDSLRVESIRSVAGEHLFFRVRNQDSLMVSLGALAGMEGEISLTVRYSGLHRPGAVEREVMQVSTVTDGPFREAPAPDDIVLEDVLVYSNRTAWYPQGPPDDYATSVVRVDVPEGRMAVTGGRRSSLRTEAARTVVEYRQDLPAKYITVAVGRVFEVGTLAAEQVAVTAYSVPRTRSTVMNTARAAADIVKFYATLFGPLPYPALNLVLIEGRTPGGHSPPGMIVLSLRPPMIRSNALRDDPASFADIPNFFLAHELAHQWWGHGVAGQNYRERWLSEALAQYAAAMWARHALGEGTFRRVMDHMAKWAIRTSAEGPIYLGHRLGHLKGDPQIFRAVVYDKGAWVLHMLRGLVGEADFAAALADLQKGHRFGKVGTEDLRLALEKRSRRDLTAYFAEWVYGTAVPELVVRQSTAPVGAAFETTVEVVPRHLPGPVSLEIAVDAGGRREVQQVALPVEGGRWTITTAARPRRVEVNADRGMLARLVKGDRKTGERGAAAPGADVSKSLSPS